MTSESVKASHILKRFPQDATDEQKAETKTAAEELLETVNAELAAGTTFAELAMAHSDDTSAAQGGDLGFFERGRMVPPFEEAAFDTLNPGEVSGLVETVYGYHIIKVEEKKAPEIRPFCRCSIRNPTETCSSKWR